MDVTHEYNVCRLSLLHLSVELSLLTLSRHRLRVSPGDRFRSRQAIPGACPWVSEHFRQIIVNENLLQYKNDVPVSLRNISIVEDYANGIEYLELSSKYNISYQRIYQIVAAYVRICHTKNKGGVLI